MSFNKAIKYKKEHRKPYYDSRRYDATCRNHGTCPACQGKVKYKKRKQLMKYAGD